MAPFTGPAGPQLMEECRKLQGCATGEAKLTRGYRLPCRYVIHTVGPIWQGGGHGERALLKACYRNSLELAREKGCETVAFPLISTGAYGYPKAQALQAAIEVITRFLLENEMTVYIVVFSKDALELGGKLFGEIKAYIDDVYVEEYLLRPEESLCRRMPGGPRRDEGFAGPEAAGASLEAMLNGAEEGFAQMLLRKIDEKGLTDAGLLQKGQCGPQAV